MNLGVPGGAHGCGREVNTKSDLQVLQWSLDGLASEQAIVMRLENLHLAVLQGIQ